MGSRWLSVAGAGLRDVFGFPRPWHARTDVVRSGELPIAEPVTKPVEGFAVHGVSFSGSVQQGRQTPDRVVDDLLRGLLELARFAGRQVKHADLVVELQ